MVVEESGDVILSGGTKSSDFPTTPGAYDTTPNGKRDIFVTCLNATGSDVVYSTYIGGSETDAGPFVRISQSGEVIIGGATYSSDFPTTPGAYDRTLNGHNDAILVRLDAAGSNLLYSTFLGGTDWDYTTGLTLDNADNMMTTGRAGPGFPTTPGAYDTTFSGGLADGYVSLLSPDGNGEQDLVYSTFIGGESEERGNGIYVDTNGMIFVTGEVISRDFPVTGDAYDPHHDNKNAADDNSDINRAGRDQHHLERTS